MMTGRFGIRNGVINHGGACADRPAGGPNRSFRDALANGGSFVNVMRDAGLRASYIGELKRRHPREFR